MLRCARVRARVSVIGESKKFSNRMSDKKRVLGVVKK